MVKCYFSLINYVLSAMKSLSLNTHRIIISMLENGDSCRKIAKKLDVGSSTVAEIRSQVTTPLKHNSGGHPAKLSPHDCRHLVRLIVSGKADTAPQLKRMAGVHVSHQTIRNALKKENMGAIVKAPKPLLKVSHLKQRQEFAEKYQHWTNEDWERVIFSDEVKINRIQSDGRSWVWKKKGAPRTKQHVKQTVKHGGGSVMIWGCITMHGVGFMCRIDGTMDKFLYKEILEDHLIQTVDWYGMDRKKFIFQQDNDPKHASGLLQEWFEDNEIQVLDWPSQSPDVNCIEHLWAYLKRKLGEYETHPRSIHELWERIEVEWEKIPQEFCINLIHSMPRRIEALLKAKGGYTKY